jgi:hypothetical protein
MIEQYTSPAVVNNSQEPWLVGEGVSLSGSIAIPSLDFNFVTDAFPGTVTFTRASTATFFDSAGVLQSAANDVPRLDYNPATLAARGLLIEESRTNSIRNNTMQGAVAGTPGTLPTNWTYGQLSTLTTEIVGTGTETGINYVDIRISGTATTTPLIYFEANSTVAATNNQTWATSVFVKIVGGGTTNISVPTTTLRMSDSGGANLGFVAGSMYTLPTSATSLSACRFSSSHTTNNASTAFVMPAFAFNAAGAIDITLRIGLPQLELGAFATSVIPTTTTSLTRSADVASVTTLSPWFNAAEGTLYVQGAYSFIASGTPGLARFDDGTDNERIFVAISSGTQRLTVVDNNVEVVDISRTGVVAGTLFAQAAAYKLNDFASVINGGAVGTDTLGGIPTVTTLRFSRNVSGSYPNGYLRRITYYPRRLSNAELQAITA